MATMLEFKECTPMEQQEVGDFILLCKRAWRGGGWGVLSVGMPSAYICKVTLETELTHKRRWLRLTAGLGLAWLLLLLQCIEVEYMVA